jgi:hypothetical protein
MAALVPTALPPRGRGARYGVLTPVLFRPRQPISDVLLSSLNYSSLPVFKNTNPDILLNPDPDLGCY